VRRIGNSMPVRRRTGGACRLNRVSVYRRDVTTSPERACLAIADVSGYTGYLAGVELDHAQDIIADLISTIVEAMAPFQLAKLEGDAAFAYLAGDSVDGSVLQDAIEGTYVAFRSRLRSIQQASSCECNACVRIPTLDLKFVVHFGSIARQQMLGNEELVGADVILVHRLLKNSIVDDLGIQAYALYTNAVVSAAGMDPQAQGLAAHQESTDVAGKVDGWVTDLGAHWQDELARPWRRISDEALLGENEWEVPTPVAVTWEWLTSPTKRQRWDTTITRFDEQPQDGRRGVGTTNHCLHGENAIREDILEWRPPRYWLMQGFAAFIPGEPGFYLSDELEATLEGGTRVVSRVGRMEHYEVGEDVLAQAAAMYSEDARVANERLRALLAEEAADVPAPEVDVPVSAARFLDEPVAS
jgi:hypothetical protein